MSENNKDEDISRTVPWSTPIKHEGVGKRAKLVSKSQPNETVSQPTTTDSYKSYTIGGVPVMFPFTPYPSQMGMMSKIISALNTGSNALLESPTGSGKSLAILCATLAWQQVEKHKRAQAYQVATQQYSTQIAAWQQKAKLKKVKLVQLPIELSSSNTYDSDDDFKTPRFAAPPSLAIKHDYETFPPPSLTDHEDSKFEISEMPKPPVFIPVPKIYVASRTHRQLTQLITEMKRNTVYKPKMSVLGSRAQYCILPSIVKQGPSVDRNALCGEALESNKCRFYDNAFGLKRAVNVECGPVWDVENLKDMGLKHRGCPYFAARHMSEDAELVFCPYNYLLDPSIRATMSINLEHAVIVLDEGHNVEDVCREASTLDVDNLVLDGFVKELDGLIEFFTSIPSDELRIYVHGVPDYKSVKNLALAIRTFVHENACQWQDVNFERKLNVLNSSLLMTHLATYDITQDSLPKLHQVFTNLNESAFDKRNDPRVQALSDLSVRTLSNLFKALVNVLDPRYANDFHIAIWEKVPRSSGRRYQHQQQSSSPGMVYSKKSGGSNAKVSDLLKPEWTHKFGIWCMNPAVSFTELSNATHSIILTSGTLAPMNSFASELGTPFPLRLEANHVIEHNQALVSVVCTNLGTQLVGTYSGSERSEYQDSVGHAILQIANTTPHGILVFVPSYAFLEKLMVRWKSTGVYSTLISVKPTVLIEPRGSKDGGLDAVLEQYYQAVNASVDNAPYANAGGAGSGAILFGVFRGKVSEGIDFANDWARAVICIGIPYPNSMDKQVQLKKTFNDTYKTQRGLLSGSEWYDIQAFRALNQALGRCIRHRHDWGMLIMLEQRMASPGYQMQVSKWVRARIQVWPSLEVGVHELERFVQSRVGKDDFNQDPTC